MQRGAPGTFVYVVNNDGTVTLRKTRLGAASGELVCVESGVQPGERVVVDGLDKLRDGALVAVIQDTNSRSPAPTPGAQHHRRQAAAAAAR